ncbi:uncharacterized protein LOC100898603 [Galendromus occidentalis]|uniref:Uncharacterized protein LOC100898603 n=1 Tax=Galendromus occidentalis TaxID=34638 RepID=A0AAJ6QQJ0_9ACAR|nr:uncharacterized protein LOC100898603 [Galendromus occidentalis]
MNLPLIIVLLSLLALAKSNPFFIAAAATQVVAAIVKIVDRTEQRSVIVENHGRHHAHLWCESRDDKIGGSDGVWIAPGKSLGWAFGKGSKTQFWCNMDWWGQRVGWDAYVHNWKDAPKITKWHIRDDGVYDEWRGRKWRNLKSE